MARQTSTLNRREALQHIGIIGIGSVVTACGGGNGGSASTATPTVAPTNGPSGTPSAAPSPSAANTATAPPATATRTSAARTLTPTEAPSNTPSPPPSATGTPEASATIAASETPAATSTPIPSCILTPEQVLGPYFIDVGLARSDVREDREGVVLRLALQLVAADGCAPIRDAVVNIWHADAVGVYSGFAGQPGGVDATGETFLRGFQVTDADGRVEFTSVYPGWYPGRTVHIHVRIHLDSTTVLVTQLYFPESITDAVHAQLPYSAHGARDVTNATDLLAGDDLDELLLELTETDSGYTGSIVLGAAL
jgi:protocatechuate 3,4-dioxygenase beta subunit